MPYTESIIRKKEENHYEWFVGGPFYCFQTRGQTKSLGGAWHRIKKKLIKISYRVNYPMDYSILFHPDQQSSRYYYSLLNVVGDEITRKIDDSVIEIKQDQDIIEKWDLAEYNEILSLYQSSIVDNDDEFDMEYDYDDDGHEISIYNFRYFSHGPPQEEPIRPEIDRSTDRQKDIVEWLEDSRHIKRFKNKKTGKWYEKSALPGFYIVRGNKVRFKDGTSSDIVDWLLAEGFKFIKVIMNYNISYTPPKSGYQEKFTFFEVL